MYEVLPPSAMPISSRRSSFHSMASPSFRELKKQASFFFKEKIKTARLALTHVTPAQLLTEEATGGDTWAPNTQVLRSISRAAFELDDYWGIVEILHNRLAKFERRKWRVSYNALLVLEYLLTHGPESVALEFQSDKDSITQMSRFHHVDERGFDWGLRVRKKSEKILKLLERGAFLKEEREKARELTRWIRGFGSIDSKSSSNGGGILVESRNGLLYSRSNSAFNQQDEEDEQRKVRGGSFGTRNFFASKSRTNLKENTEPEFLDPLEDKAEATAAEASPLLGCRRDELKAQDSKEEDETMVLLIPSKA